MLLALAALLIQPVFFAQHAFSTQKIVLPLPGDLIVAGAARSEEIPLPFTQARADILMRPGEDPDLTATAEAPEPVPVGTPRTIALLKPGRPMTVSLRELLAEGRGNRRLWLGLAVAAHSAATFDAWTTRHAISTGAGRELNPLFKPFAGNASLYLAIQAGPVLVDYLGRRLMYSRHGWIRRIWWIPQGVSVAASLFCGAHNLRVGAAAN